MVMNNLILHPDCPAGPVTSVSAAIEATETGCRAVFRVNGDLDAIIIPEIAEPARMDNLWQTTCFEIFWQPGGDTYYREFNLSSSTRWACYEFDDFRLNRSDAPAGVTMQIRREGGALMVQAEIVSELPVPGKVALNAVIEDKQGNIQFWALAFPAGKPEFHSTACRTLQLEDRAA